MMTEGQCVRCVQGLFMERRATCTISIYQSTVCTVLHSDLAVYKYLQNKAEGTIAECQVVSPSNANSDTLRIKSALTMLSYPYPPISRSRTP
jgi:hypothetical protein